MSIWISDMLTPVKLYEVLMYISCVILLSEMLTGLLTIEYISKITLFGGEYPILNERLE
ncbi:MAG: hypothetical protein OWQ50_03370 [Acidianus infernus]|nr:hypothetical protein [Acidianus infernus]